jgi:hypothetical protein
MVALVGSASGAKGKFLLPGTEFYSPNAPGIRLRLKKFVLGPGLIDQAIDRLVKRPPGEKTVV